MSTIPPGSAIVTASEMFAEVRATHTAVTEMRSELRQITDHETRIRGLERRMWIASGAAAILGGGLSEAVRAIFGA